MRTRTGRMAWMAGAVVVAGAAPPSQGQLTFTDVTESSGLLHAQDPHPQFFSPLIWKMAGGASADFNKDGWPDLFVGGGGEQPDRLFLNQGDGTFVEQGVAWGVGEFHYGAGIAVGDVNGDGWDDICMMSYGEAGSDASPGKHRLYINKAGERFEEMAQQAGVAWAGDVTGGTSPAFGDYDLDGDLDLFMGDWMNWPGVNRLFENQGDGTFVDVTEAAGMVVDGARAYAPRFVDMTGDRLPEMLLTADFHTSQYLVNNGDGTFTNQTGPAGVGPDCNGMGASVADFDGDGDMDWFITAIYFEFGGPCGNMFYMNERGVFNVWGVESGAANAGWGWGSASDDLDNDRDVDLVVTNGWPQWPIDDTRVFLNNGAATFEAVEQEAGLIHSLQGRGIVTWDYDRDGDRDVAIMSYDGPLKVYRNDLSGAGTNWVALDLDTSAHPCLAPNGFGTWVEIDVAGETLTRVMETGSNFLSQSERTMHVGLGAAEVADEIRVQWHDGTETVLTDVAANQFVTVVARHAADANGDGELNVFDFVAFQTGFYAGDDVADCDGDGDLDVFDFPCFQQAFLAGCEG